MNLDAEHIMTLHVQCSSSLDIKNEGRGYLRVIPITGGTVTGRITGEIVPGGADWNTTFDSNLAHVRAKYLIRTSDGEYIDIENEGLIRFDRESRIKTKPSFRADERGKYAWLNHGVYVASLDPGNEDGQVIINVYRLS